VNIQHLFRVSHTHEQLREMPRPDDCLSHADLADNLAAVCESLGWQPQNVAAALGNKLSTESAIGLTVTPTGVPPLPDGWLHVLALHYCYPRSGHWASRAMRLYHGVAPDCGYGVPLGAYRFWRRGNQYARQPVVPQIHEALEDTLHAFHGYPERLFMLRGWKMSRRECERLMLDAARQETMPRSRVFRVIDDALQGQSEAAFWDVLQAFARTARVNRPVTEQMRQVWQFVQAVEELGVGV
jgi:hypothetical protein